LFSDPHKTVYAVCFQNVELYSDNFVVHIATTWL